MKKGKTKFKIFGKIVTFIIVMFFCMFTLTACLGGGYSGGSSSGGSTGGGDKPKPGDDDKPKPGEDDKPGESISDYDDVMLGAIGVYDCDSNETEIFYDNYQDGFVSFNTLIDRQFLALANVLRAGLYKAYDSSSFRCTITGFGSDKNVEDKIISKENIHNDDKTKFYYEQAWNGGYLIDTATYEYDTDNNGPYLWKKFSGGGPDASEIAKDLRAIYLNTKPISDSASAGKFGFTDDSLINTYNNFTGGVTDNSGIDTIGFTQDYMFNVLYYLAYSVVGQDAFKASMDARNGVNLTGTNTITADNYLNIQNYKGYEVVLPELVSNAFKLVITGDKTIGVSQNPYDYCWNTLGNTTIGTTTLFPMIQRKEYIFFDSIHDISDAEVLKEVDWEKFMDEYNKMTEKQKEEWNKAQENKTVNPGTARRLNQIILLPKIDSNKYKKSSYAITGLSVCFSSSSGEFELQIVTNATDSTSQKIKNKVFAFEDGSYEVEMPDGTVINGESSDPMVTKDKHLIIQSQPKPNLYGTMGFILDSEDEAENYQFTSISSDAEKIVTNAFDSHGKDTSYIVAGTNEKINIKRLGVWNQIISSTRTINNNLATLKFGVNNKVLDKNYMTFDFNYFEKGGKTTTSPKDMYILDFDIF